MKEHGEHHKLLIVVVARMLVTITTSIAKRLLMEPSKSNFDTEGMVAVLSKRDSNVPT